MSDRMMEDYEDDGALDRADLEILRQESYIDTMGKVCAGLRAEIARLQKIADAAKLVHNESHAVTGTELLTWSVSHENMNRLNRALRDANP